MCDVSEFVEGLFEEMVGGRGVEEFEEGESCGERGCVCAEFVEGGLEVVGGRIVEVRVTLLDENVE